MVVFPSKAGIDAWATLGNPGWTWQEMAPYYRKFHTLAPPTEESIRDLSLTWIRPENQGTSGPLKVSFAGSDFYGPLHMAWPKTFKNLNYKTTGDPISGVMQGAYCNPTTVDVTDKSRSYAASAYYPPEVAKRSNLHVLTKAQVEKIMLIKGSPEDDAQASAVQFATDGQRFTVKVAREVLLCAGAIQSPQILELSGIGNPVHLKSIGIEPVVENSNVGENMQDHALASISFEVVEGTPTAEALTQPGVMEAMIEQYKRNRSGPLTSSAICNSYMPLPEYLEKTGNESEHDELFRLIDEYTQGSFATGRKEQYKLLRSILKDGKDSTVQYHLCAFQLNPHAGPGPSSWLGMKEPGNYLTIPANLSHPFSRGSVHAESSDVSQHPRIDPGYLSNPLDLEVLARHVMFSETIAKTKPMGDFVKDGGRRIPVGAYAETVEKAKDLVRQTLVSTYHPTSTCSMMPQEIGGVVDSRLKVYGVRNLRVVDASVFPLIPRGNIQTSVYATAEKAADMIREDQKI